MTTEFTPLAGLAGGLLIGLSAVLLMLASGRIAGISGIFAGALDGALGRGDAGETLWRALYLVGILLGAGLAALLGLYSGAALFFQPSMVLLALAGLLVGFGTQLGSGCTSGHGVCGLARLSGRSLAATGTFMGVAVIVVFITRHLI